MQFIRIPEKQSIQFIFHKKTSIKKLKTIYLVITDKKDANNSHLSVNKIRGGGTCSCIIIMYVCGNLKINTL